MYEYIDLAQVKHTTKAAVEKVVDRYGVSIYVECDPDWCGPDIVIDAKDQEGLKLFREFAQKMSMHYETLKVPHQ